MLTGKKYKYGSALWRIMLLAQVGIFPSVNAHPGDGVLVAGAPIIPSMPSLPNMASKAAAVNIHPELAKAARAYHAQYQTLPDMKAISVKAAVMTQISAAGDAIKHRLKTQDVGKMNPFTSKAMVMRELPKAAQAMLKKMSMPVIHPEGSTIKAGDAEIRVYGHTMDIVTKGQTAIDWDKFNVGKGNTLRIRQDPSTRSPDAVLLNRVTGTDKSVIEGLVQAPKDHVWIVNPNGFRLEDGAKIGADLLTTKSITDTNFLAAHYLFDTNGLESEASEIKITGKVEFATPGKWLTLAARNVTQDAPSVLVAPSHQVKISNATVFAVDVDGDGLITSAVDLKKASPALAEQLKAQAEAGDKHSWVVLGSDDLAHAFKGAISMDGVVEAGNVKVDAKSGSIRLMGDNVTVTGKLSATGQGTEGGTIYVTGQNVNVGSKAHIDVSGDTGGGKIAVGGANTKGYDPEAGKLPKAKNTTIAEGAILEASARVNGPAGIVNTWADVLNKDGSTIVAKSGPKEGPRSNDGAKIERSAAEVFDLTDSKLDVEAGPGGASAKATFDPADVSITALGGVTAAPTVRLAIGTITGALAGADVTVATETPESAPVSGPGGSNGSGGGWRATGLGSITMANGGAPIDIAAVGGNRSLTLDAGQNIVVSDSLAAGAHNIIMRARTGNVQIQNTLSTTTGVIGILADAGSVTFGGNITVGSNAITVQAANQISLNGRTVTLGAGDLNLRGGSYDFTGFTPVFTGAGVVKAWNGTGYTQIYPPLPPAPPVPLSGGGIVPPNLPLPQAQALADINRNGLPPLGYVGMPGYMPGVGPMPTGPIAPPSGGMLGPVGPMPVVGSSPQGGMVGPMGPVGPVPGYSNISIVNAPAPMGMGMPSGMPMMSIGAPTALAGPSMASLGSYGLSFAPTPPPSGRVGVYGGMPSTPPPPGGPLGPMPAPGGSLGPVPTPGGTLGAPTGPGGIQGIGASAEVVAEPGSTSEGTSKLGTEPKGTAGLTPLSQGPLVVPSTAAGA